MKKIVYCLIIFIVIFGLIGCTDPSLKDPTDETKAVVPLSYSSFKGDNFIDVKKEFEKVGFTNIKYEIIYDLTTGFLVSDGEIESVSIDGSTLFNAGDEFDKNVEIIITYHTFKSNESTSPDEPDNPVVTTLSKDVFLDARENTIGKNVNSFEYDYTINASANVLSKSITGKTIGNSKYSQTGDVSFYDVHENTGALFYDGSKYQIKLNDQLQTIKINNDGDCTSFKSEKVDYDYKCDFGTFAKVLFTYKDSDISSLEETETNGKYKLNTKISASDVITLIGNNINNPIVENIIGELPETSVNTNMYITLNDNLLETYIYEITINVSAIQFSLKYELKFKNINNVSNIETINFENILYDRDKMDKQKNQIYNYLNYGKPILQDDYVVNNTDLYYLYNSYLNIDDITYIQENKNEETLKYIIGVSNNEVISLLRWLNGELDLDPLNINNEKIKIFGNFNEESVVVNEIVFEIVIKEDKLNSINITCEGEYETALEGSKNFSSTKKAIFDFDLSIKVNSEDNTFTAYENIEDVK